MNSTDNDSRAFRNCSVCSQLSDKERGFQKYTREEENTYLPEAAAKLEVVKDLGRGEIRLPAAESTEETPQYLDIPSSRVLQLKRCRQCGTYYLYRTDYEFLPMFGTEDEQELTRLTDSQASECLLAHGTDSV